MFTINFNFDVKKLNLLIYRKLLVKVANETYKKLNLQNEIIFDSSFVDLKTIQEINMKHRNINQPTDVISFALWDKGYKSNLLGEIYICYEKIVEQKKLYRHSFKRELCFLFLHGLLHLLGYDHVNKKDEEVMFGLQDEILDSLGIRR